MLVDGITSRGVDGKSVWRELTQPELDRIATLVRSAIGFDEKRGDHVEVVNMRFSAPDELADAAPAGSWLQFGKSDLIWLATIGLIALVALFALGFVIRPLALKLVSGLPGPSLALAPPMEAGGLPVSGPLPLNALAGLPGPLPIAGTPVLPVNQSLESPDKDTMLNVANIQGVVRASAIRKLGELVESQPDASVTVIRGWLAQKVG